MSDPQGRVGHDRGNVVLMVGSNTWALAPDIARAVAKELRRGADKADAYRRKLDRAAKTAMPVRVTDAGVLHAVPDEAPAP